MESFQQVLDLENGEKGEWGFKALKQMIKINFRLVSVVFFLKLRFENENNLKYFFQIKLKLKKG